MDKNTFCNRKEIIEALHNDGYEIIEHRSSSFPYSNFANDGVISDTINAVAKANLLILIVDENYGSIVDSRSVTHHEYRKAVELNLPMFIFINKHIWNDFEKNNLSHDSYIKSEAQLGFIKELAFNKITVFDSASDCLEHIKQQLLNYLGGFLKFSRQTKWLWNQSYTRLIEETAREVWVITSDFLWDFDDPEFHHIVATNVISRNCVYKYIYKDSPENNAKKDEMMRIYKLSLKRTSSEGTLENRVQFLPVKKERYYWSCEQILYNPMELDERAIMVDIMDIQDKTLKFNIEYGFKKRMEFRKQFITYWNTFGRSHGLSKISLSDHC